MWATKVVFNCKRWLPFTIANARACKGVAFADLFLTIVLKDLYKENSCFWSIWFFGFGKGCFVFAFEMISITIKYNLILEIL